MRLESRKYMTTCGEPRACRQSSLATGLSLTTREDAMLRAAVERQFEIIGETMARLARSNGATAARISGYRHIIAFRNVLIHGYADADDRRCGTSSRQAFRTSYFRGDNCLTSSAVSGASAQRGRLPLWSGLGRSPCPSP